MSSSENPKKIQLFITLLAILICAVILAITQAIKGSKGKNMNAPYNSNNLLNITFPNQETPLTSNTNTPININY